MLGDTCELILLLRPRAYLIGNVPGLDDATQWHHVQRALAPLRKAGYCIADYVSLDAADYGVPQHRIRPFWFGHLEGPCVA
jgi:DNA (cytosine-5)-methyltransferase 1